MYQISRIDMYLPGLNEIPQKVVETNDFRGINDTFFIPEGYLKNMKNMTSDYYPLLGNREQRRIYKTENKINGVITVNEDVYTASGNGLYKNGDKIEDVSLTDNEKTMLVYGAYIVIFPDKVMYNTSDGTVTNMGYSRTFVGGTSSVRAYLSDSEGNRIIVLPETNEVAKLFITDNMKNRDKQITEYIESHFATETHLPEYLEMKTVYYDNESTGQNIYKHSIVTGSKHLIEAYGKTSYPLYFGAVDNDNKLSIESYSEQLSMWSEVELYVTVYRREKSEEEAKKISDAIKPGDYVRMVALDEEGEEITERTSANSSYWNMIKHFKEYTKVEKVLQKGCSVGIVFSNVGADFLSVLRDTPGYYKVGNTAVEISSGNVVTERSIYSLNTIIGFPWGNNSDVTSICRKMKLEKGIPDMDYMTVSNNRIWGCSNDKHEIYACKQGDATSWYCYAGLANDSYAVTIGSEGDFTGACTYKDEPYFFKEDLIICMYGTKPSNYQVSEYHYMGVEKGSDKSICYLNGYMYYKSREGIVRFDGSSPSLISEELGKKSFGTARAGVSERKYYVAMEENGNDQLFVYDTEKGMWHKEDDLKPDIFFRKRGCLFAVMNENIIRLAGREEMPIQGNVISAGDEIEQYRIIDGIKLYNGGLEWYAETGPIENGTVEHKYIQRLGMKYELEEMATLSVMVKYDNCDTWVNVFTRVGKKNEGAVDITFKPRRCEKFRIRLEGRGNCRIHGLRRLVNEGSVNRYGKF